jgi:hypoxanthine phosphoribosyltransferase
MPSGMPRAPTRPTRRKPVRAAARKPAAGKVHTFSSSQEPDEFGAPSGIHAVGLPSLNRPPPRKVVTELSWADFDRHVQRLALSARTSFRPSAVVGLVHGGVFVGGAIASALQVDFYPVRVSHRSRDHQEAAGGLFELPRDLLGRRVLVVDDVSASGDSLEFAVRLARDRGVKHLATAALVARPGRYRPDFSALESEDFFVFPWDYASLVADGRFEPDAARPAGKSPGKSRAAR